jgi:hypothetical protein
MSLRQEVGVFYKVLLPEMCDMSSSSWLSIYSENRTCEALIVLLLKLENFFSEEIAK